MIAVLLALLTALLPQVELVRVTHPLELIVPKAAVSSWDSFDSLAPAPANARVSLLVGGAPPTRGRVDVFLRLEDQWRLSNTYGYITGTPLTLEQSQRRRAVLLRFEQGAFYYWGELQSGHDSARLERFKNVTFDAAQRTGQVVIYSPDRDIPRVVSAHSGVVRAVQFIDLIFCRVGGSGETCTLLPANATTIVFPPIGFPTRVLRVPPEFEAQFAAKAASRFAIQPKAATVTTQRVPRWIALQLPNSDHQWSDIVVDITGEFAATRVEGASLPDPPGVFEVHPDIQHGVSVRAHPGEIGRQVEDTSAVLMVFPAGASQVSQEVPLMTASIDRTGQFSLPQLGEGEYQFKLLSTSATAEPKVASVTPGATLDLLFNTGPAVTGRVSLTSGGISADPVMIEIVPAIPISEALHDRALADKMRMTKADQDGRFRVVLGGPGKYHLRARWGSASAEREFELSKDAGDVDVGDIALQSGSSLHGVLSPCIGGEIAVIPVPDLSRSFTTAVGEIRHARVQPDGHFVVSGLTRGQWSVTARCASGWIELAPSIIQVPESGDVVATFAVK